MANSSNAVTHLNLDVKSEESSKAHSSEFKPCLKHAVEVLAESPSEKSSKQFCENCSQTMLSYIFLIQDALDNLARKIYGGENKHCCLQCLRQESSTKVGAIDNEESAAEIYEHQKETPNESSFQSDYDATSLQKVSTPDIPTSANPAQKPRRKSSIRRNSRLYREQKEYENMNSRASLLSIESNVDKQGWKIDFLYDLSPKYRASQTPLYESNGFNKIVVISVDKEECTNVMEDINNSQEKNKPDHIELSNNNRIETMFSNDKEVFSHHDQIKSQNIQKSFLADNHEVVRDNLQPILNQANNEVEYYILKNNSVDETNSCLVKSIGACEPTKHEVQSLENSCITNGDHKNILDPVQFATEQQNSSEAFVTICRNNAEILGCLALGCSLQLCRTSKTLCVLVLDNVDSKLRTVLSSVFNVVETVTSLGTASSSIATPLKHCLAKLNVWRLLNFSKCVFLNPDTLVIHNCDELFQCEELSAVPDTGWPDCFNTGVFVFVPSVEKFSDLVELAKKQEHCSDGEDMVLNSFFDSWACDISKKLSFIYNLVDNKSYTYASAFQRFGHNVKIVQFTGSSKPWQVKFSSHTNEIQEETGAHQNFTRFFHEWISIFRAAVLRLLPQDINSKVLSQNILAAEDILKFIEPPVQKVIPKSISNISYEDFNVIDSLKNPREENGKGIWTISSKLKTSAVEEVEQTLYNTLFSTANSTPILAPSIGFAQSQQNGKSPLIDVSELLSISSDASENNSGYDTKNLDLPGSVVGDYQGMRIWEQGQMDYAGCDNSENIIKRLQFLMDQPQYKVSELRTDTKIAINQYI